MASISNKTQIFQLLSFGSHIRPYPLQLCLSPALHLAHNNGCAVSSPPTNSGNMSNFFRVHGPLAVCAKLERPVKYLAKLWYVGVSATLSISLPSVIYNPSLRPPLQLHQSRTPDWRSYQIVSQKCCPHGSNIYILNSCQCPNFQS